MKNLHRLREPQTFHLVTRKQLSTKDPLPLETD